MMSKKTVISVKNLSKSFKLPHQKNSSLKGAFVNLNKGKRSFEKQQVLKNISFDVKDGEFLGIVGRNGSGKSTLLKLLAEIYVPDSGSVNVNGSLAPFIELGVGFNPELTGRENVYLNGSLLGFNRKQMDEMYDGIVEFAELERFMDQKLKNYSSGMQVRLAFSVAIKAHTEILLIDEVLAVGDANFQKKCFDVFYNFKKEGRTVIFISHSMDSVRKFCDRAILIDAGEIKLDGETEVVAAEYDLLNKENMKQYVNRLTISNRREAHIVDKVVNNFKEDDYMIEIGAGDGRHVELLSSMGFNVAGLDVISNNKNVYKKLSAIPDLKKVTSLLILDNKKSINSDFLNQVFQELKNGELNNVQSIYIHTPFYLYQSQRELHKAGINKHLAQPLDIIQLSLDIRKYGFEVINYELYEADEPFQYSEMFMERFNLKEATSIWPSLKG